MNIFKSLKKSNNGYQAALSAMIKAQEAGKTVSLMLDEKSTFGAIVFAATGHGVERKLTKKKLRWDELSLYGLDKNTPTVEEFFAEKKQSLARASNVILFNKAVGQ